jgi:hypothetical protein
MPVHLLVKGANKIIANEETSRAALRRTTESAGKAAKTSLVDSLQGIAGTATSNVTAAFRDLETVQDSQRGDASTKGSAVVNAAAKTSLGDAGQGAEGTCRRQ